MAYQNYYASAQSGSVGGGEAGGGSYVYDGSSVDGSGGSLADNSGRSSTSTTETGSSSLYSGSSLYGSPAASTGLTGTATQGDAGGVYGTSQMQQNTAIGGYNDGGALYGGSVGSAASYTTTNNSDLGTTAYSGLAYMSAPQYSSQINAVGGVGYGYTGNVGLMGAGGYGGYGMGSGVGMYGAAPTVPTSPYGTGAVQNMADLLANQYAMMGGVSSMDVDSSPYGGGGGLAGTSTGVSGYDNYGTSQDVYSCQQSQSYGGGLGTGASTYVNSYDTSALSTTGNHAVDDNDKLVNSNTGGSLNNYSSPYY